MYTFKSCTHLIMLLAKYTKCDTSKCKLEKGLYLWLTFLLKSLPIFGYFHSRAPPTRPFINRIKQIPWNLHVSFCSPILPFGLLDNRIITIIFPKHKTFKTLPTLKTIGGYLFFGSFSFESKQPKEVVELFMLGFCSTKEYIQGTCMCGEGILDV